MSAPEAELPVGVIDGLSASLLVSDDEVTRTLPDEEEDPGAATVLCNASGTEVSVFVAPEGAEVGALFVFVALLGATDGLPLLPSSEKKTDKVWLPVATGILETERLPLAGTPVSNTLTAETVNDATGSPSSEHSSSMSGREFNVKRYFCSRRFVRTLESLLSLAQCPCIGWALYADHATEARCGALYDLSVAHTFGRRTGVRLSNRSESVKQFSTTITGSTYSH